MRTRVPPVEVGSFRMSRPDQLLLVAVAYALGTVVAVARGTSLDGEDFLGGLASPVFVASIHYANEYADHETDALAAPHGRGDGAARRRPARCLGASGSSVNADSAPPPARSSRRL